MKNNKLKIIAFILVLIVLILLIIVFVIKVTKYSIKDSEYNNVNDNKAYIEHRDKNHKTVDKLKTVQAKDDNIEQINTYLKNVHFNGSITVLKDGKLMLDKGYGYQNISSKKKSNANTMYLIGSAQKFTTGLILKHLELSNKININDPVTKYLPWFKTNKTISLKDLMLHRSGLYKFSANPNTKSLDGAVHDIQRRGINSKYYHKHLYNDANYLVLAQVIEAVTHHSYVENYYKFLAEPYHLEHSAFFNEKPYKKNMATGYKVKNEKLKTMKPNTLDQYYGAGNLFMSTHDMARLVNDLQQNNILIKQLQHLYSKKLEALNIQNLIDMDSIRLLKSIELMVCFSVKYSRYILMKIILLYWLRIKLIILKCQMSQLFLIFIINYSVKIFMKPNKESYNEM